jgi:hypothetical protein
MEGNVFTEDILKHHEGVKDKRLFTLLVDSISEDEEIYETHININGEEDFRLEVEENVEDDIRSICVSVYRVLYGEHVSSSITAQIEYEQRGAVYHYVDDDSKEMSLAQVYSEIMDLIRRVEKVALE